MDCSCGAPWCDARNVCSAALIRDRRDPDGNRHVKGGGEGDFRWARCSGECIVCDEIVSESTRSATLIRDLMNRPITVPAPSFAPRPSGSWTPETDPVSWPPTNMTYENGTWTQS